MQQITFIFAITISSIPFILVLLSIIKWKKWTKISMEDEEEPHKVCCGGSELDYDLTDDKLIYLSQFKKNLNSLLKNKNYKTDENSSISHLCIEELNKYSIPFMYNDGNENFCLEWANDQTSIVLHFSEKMIKGSSTNLVSNEYNNYNLLWTYIIDNNESFENLLKWLFEKPKELEPHPSIIEDDLTPVI
jgi:hypothetical protein